MKTIKIKLYEFDELSDKAKQKAIEECRPTEYFWADENRATLEAFEKIFPVSIRNWSYGGRGEGVSFSFDENDSIEELSGWRLATYIWNNYRNDIYTHKQYWRCGEHFNCVGANSKHTESKIFLNEFGCPLTGYYMDNEIIAPLFDFMRKPDNSDFRDLMESCFDAWVSACNKDAEHQHSDEFIIEEITSQGFTFEEDGSRRDA